MKTFIVTWQHNYGLGVAIINAKSLEKADNIASKSNSIWDNYFIEELDTSTELQIIE